MRLLIDVLYKGPLTLAIGFGIMGFLGFIKILTFRWASSYESKRGMEVEVTPFKTPTINKNRTTIFDKQKKLQKAQIPHLTTAPTYIF